MSRAQRAKRATTQDTPLSVVPDRPVFQPPAPFSPQTRAQGRYVTSIRRNIVTMATGPAGVGKTYVSLSIAADMLMDGRIDTLYLVRPLVTACDEDIGFLPGDVQEKIDPYFAPAMLILRERLGKSLVEYFVKVGRIVMVPLAFIRGMTLTRCFVLVTEAQNMTPKQFKLLLTRIGNDCKAVLEGDISQSDIDGNLGLEDALDRLSGMDDVEHVEFSLSDIVRSGICRDMVLRYEGV